jgi:acetyl esterase/lipase
MFLIGAMTSDILQDTQLEDLKDWEKKFVTFVNINDLLVDDYKNKKDDINAFPGRMPVSELKKLPPAVVCTSEFDSCNRDCFYLKGKLEEAGKLLDFQNIPGMHTGFQLDGTAEETDWFYEECAVAFNKYVCDVDISAQMSNFEPQPEQ